VVESVDDSFGSLLVDLSVVDPVVVGVDSIVEVVDSIVEVVDSIVEVVDSSAEVVVSVEVADELSAVLGETN
jgi:hypothetical protein